MELGDGLHKEKGIHGKELYLHERSYALKRAIFRGNYILGSYTRTLK